MLQHFYAPQQRRRFNVNTWMPSTSGSVFGGGMSPLEACFMPSMLDIFEPLLNLNRVFNRGQRWNQPSFKRRQNVRSKPQTRMIEQVPSYGGKIGGVSGIQKPMLPKSTVVSKGMSQKYRIAIDCCGFSQQNIRTNVKLINGVYHLIVSCCSSGKQERGVRCGTVSTEFRRSYTLPRSCDIKKMEKYMCNGVFVIEFPLLEQPVLVKCDKLKPTVVKCEGSKMMSLRVPIPELVNRANLQCFVRDRDLILRFEYKIQPDTVSRVYCYTKVPLPAQCNLNQIKCKLNKKRLLTVCAPLLTTTTGVRPTMAKFRCIHIERKLRHRISGKQPLIQPESIIGKSIEKKGITGKKQSSVVGKQQIGGKQQISKSGISKRTSGVFSDLFGKVPEKKQVTPRKEEKQTPVVQKKKTVKPEHVVSGQKAPIKKTPSGTNIKTTPSGTNIKKTPSGANIKKTSSGKQLFQETGKQATKQRTTGEESKRGVETLHRIIGSGRKSPEGVERRESPEGRKSPQIVSNQ